MKILVDNGKYIPVNYTTILPKLPIGTYTVSQSQAGFYLQQIPDFEIPKKVYGDLENHADRYIKSFDKVNKNMGLLLNGEKGSGKTLLSHLICKRIGLPVLVLNSAYGGTGFINFIDSFNQELVVLIDEFDKLYKENHYGDDGDERATQTELLKLLDQGTRSKKMYILTSNDDTVSRYMRNRPSRIRYKRTFSKLSKEEVSEILDDKLKYKKYKDEFISLVDASFNFNLDTLLILIDEVNMWNESPRKLISDLNIAPESENYRVTYIDKAGKEFESNTRVEFNPFVKEFYLRLYYKDGSGKTAHKEIHSYNLTGDFTLTKEHDTIKLLNKKEKYTLLLERVNNYVNAYEF